MLKKIVILGIDNFSHKNYLQLSKLNEYGYTYDVFTYDCHNNSFGNFPGGMNNLYLISVGVKKVIDLFKYLFKHRIHLNHAEIYFSGGIFCFICLIMCKMMGIKTIMVERGDIGFIKRYPKIIQCLLIFCYRNTDIVWYRELYMRSLLDKFKVKRSFFVHNAVSSPPEKISHNKSEREYDFLWVNRLITERNSSWFINALKSDGFEKTSNVLLGILGEKANNDIQLNEKYVIQAKLNNLKVEGFIDPTFYYKHSKFFVLPSSLVFANNSLLEAMSYGVVPIVSKAEGAQLIVNHGKNGYICNNNESAFIKMLRSALTLNDRQFREMSIEAKKKVESDFSIETWKEQILDLYLCLDGVNTEGNANDY